LANVATALAMRLRAPATPKAGRRGNFVVCQKTIGNMEDYDSLLRLETYAGLGGTNMGARVQDVWCQSFCVQGTQEETEAVSTVVMSMLTLQFTVKVGDTQQLPAHGSLEEGLRDILNTELNRVPLFEKDQIGMGSAEVDGTLTLLARVRVSNVHILQYLRDLVLSTSETWCAKEKGQQVGQEKNRQEEGQGDFLERIKAEMKKRNLGTVELNKGAFVESYERALYHFETMTEEQTDVYTKCHMELRRQRILIDRPEGLQPAESDVKGVTVEGKDEIWCPKEKGPYLRFVCSFWRRFWGLQEDQEKSRQEGQGDFSEQIKAEMTKSKQNDEALRNRRSILIDRGELSGLARFEGRSEVLEIPTVRIDGAAGTGKTFLALHALLIHLRQDRTVLFVARNTALGYFAAGWAYRRLRLHMTSKRAMAAMEYFWTLSLDGGEVKLRKCKITEKTSEITFNVWCPSSMYPSVYQLLGPKCPDSMYPSVYRLLGPKYPLFSFELVVVDEAHHVYGYEEETDGKAQYFCEFMERCCQGCKERVLFSDVSQSWHGEYDMSRFPPHQSFNMDVVVRSTERVVLGAMVIHHMFPYLNLHCNHSNLLDSRRSLQFSSCLLLLLHRHSSLR
jgi:hypothetical protein